MDFWGRLVVGRWRDGQGLAGAGSGFSHSGNIKGRRQGIFHEVAFHRERVHERKDEKGANWKTSFCGSATSARAKNAKPLPGADLKNWKQGKSRKGLLIMAAMGVFLFLMEREPLTLAYMCS